MKGPSLEWQEDYIDVLIHYDAVVSRLTVTLTSSYRFTVTKLLHHVSVLWKQRCTLWNLLQVSLVSLTTHSWTETRWRISHFARRLGKCSMNTHNPVRDRSRVEAKSCLLGESAPLLTKGEASCQEESDSRVRTLTLHWLTADNRPE